MGYYVTLTDADFIIPADKLNQAYEAMCRLNTTHNDQKRGGCWGAGKDPNAMENRWFSWMDWNYPETCQNAGDILAQLGFELYDTPDGGLQIAGYDSKTGQEDLFIEALAPFVAEGSSLTWRGEDGEMWRHEVRNGRLVRLYAEVTFKEA